MGNQLLQGAQVLDREHLAREVNDPERRPVVALEAAELGQKREDRRRRIPAR